MLCHPTSVFNRCFVTRVCRCERWSPAISSSEPIRSRTACSVASLSCTTSAAAAAAATDSVRWSSQAHTACACISDLAFFAARSVVITRA